MVDTYVYDLTQTPNWNNFGSMFYDNMDEFAVDGAVPSFVNYVEGIYVGYKFYETAAAEGLIDYDTTVQYPFGYGLSYTTFTQEMGTISESNGTITFDVTVTNTGDVAGKDVVQVYYNPPYTNGGIRERPGANLIAFDKTDMLEPGASQTLTISFDVEDMASYDTYGAGATCWRPVTTPSPSTPTPQRHRFPDLQCSRHHHLRRQQPPLHRRCGRFQPVRLC